MNKTYILAACILAAVPAAFCSADTATDQKIAQLEQQLNAIQKELAELKTASKSNNAVQAPAKDSVKISGYIQNFLTMDNRSVRGDGAKADTFKIRRAYITFDGSLGNSKWRMQIDPARDLKYNSSSSSVDQSSRMLMEAWVSTPLTDGWNLTVGQNKIPFGLEAMMSSSKMETAERSMMTTKGAIDMQYELGASVNKTGKDGSIALALINGSAQNTVDNNDAKDISGRFVYTPGKAWSIGASAYKGWKDADRKADNRLAGELQYKDADWILRSEVYEARFGDGASKREPVGYYLLAGRKLNPTWQVVTRWDHYDPNRWATKDTTNEWTVGLNHDMPNNMLWQMNFVHSSPATGMKTDSLINNLQITF